MRHRAKLRAARIWLPLHHHYVIPPAGYRTWKNSQGRPLRAPCCGPPHPLILPTFVAMEAAPPPLDSPDVGCASHFKPTAPWTWRRRPTRTASVRHYASIGGGPKKKCLLLFTSSVNLPRRCLLIATKTHSFCRSDHYTRTKSPILSKPSLPANLALPSRPSEPVFIDLTIQTGINLPRLLLVEL